MQISKYKLHRLVRLHFFEGGGQERRENTTRICNTLGSNLDCCGLFENMYDLMKRQNVSYFVGIVDKEILLQQLIPSLSSRLFLGMT